MLHHTINGRRQGKGLPLLLGCLLLVAVALRCEAQNLVPNPSMEEHSECPVTIGFQGFSKPLHWEKWENSPEYFHECAGSLGGVDTLIGVPQNGFGYQYAFHGQAYIGMVIFGIWGFREYVGCELLQPLEPGTTYYLSFWTNVAGGVGAGGSYWWNRHASNNVGMLFTMEHNIWEGNSEPPFALRNYAHLHSDEIIADPDEWVQVSGSFVADSAYAYLVLGNFFSNELTDTMQIVPGGSLSSYYFIDAVCVTTSPAGCDFFTGVQEQGTVGVRLFPNPATDHIMLEDDGLAGQWEVYDMLGRSMAIGHMHGSMVKVPTGSWPQGQYVLVVRREAQVVQRRFNVMR
jgi:hypothetical protein